MPETATRRSAQRRPVRRVAAVLAVVVMAAIGAWAWGQFGPQAQREREIADALRSVIGNCDDIGHRGHLSSAQPGKRLGLSCGPYEQVGGPWIGATKYGSRGEAEVAFRRAATDPTQTTCRTDTEVFLIDFTSWPSGAWPRKLTGVAADAREFCAAVGAGPPDVQTEL